MYKKCILIICLLVLIFSFGGCSKKEQTLEEVIKEKSNSTKELDSTLDSAGLKNVEYKIKDNTITLDMEISELFEDRELTDDEKKNLSEEFEKSFNDTKNDFNLMIEEVENEYKVKNIEIKINVKYKDDILYSNIFKVEEQSKEED